MVKWAYDGSFNSSASQVETNGYIVVYALFSVCVLRKGLGAVCPLSPWGYAGLCPGVLVGVCYICAQ